MMNSDQLWKIWKRWSSISKGPYKLEGADTDCGYWIVDSNWHYKMSIDPRDPDENPEVVGSVVGRTPEEAKHDAEFHLHAPDDIGKLLGEVKRLKKRERQLRGQVKRLKKRQAPATQSNP